MEILTRTGAERSWKQETPHFALPKYCTHCSVKECNSHRQLDEDPNCHWVGILRLLRNLSHWQALFSAAGSRQPWSNKQSYLLNTDHLREGFRKKCEKVWSFAKPGGSPGVVKKPNCFFETEFFQRVSRIILGPPKHVLHLVWSAYFISTAVRTAFKVARTPQILGGKKAIIEAIIGAKNNRF